MLFGVYAKITKPNMTHTVIGKITLLVVVATAALIPGREAAGQTSSVLSSSEEQSNKSELRGHMSEDLRSSIKKVVVVAGQKPVSQEIAGTYEKETKGLLGGMDSGSRVGTISKDVGPVPVSFGVPILTIPGAIFGGLSGAAKREIQDFRDELTEQLAQAGSQPLKNDGLALDVFWGLRRLPNLDSHLFGPNTPIPADTDAILYVSLNDVEIDVQGKEAVITTSAVAALRQLGDNRDLYETVIQYQDRDTLSHWTEDDNALWRDYANFARHYLGREISADVFDGIKLQHELRPRETATAVRARKDERQFVSRSLSPTLAWELTLVGGDSYGAWPETIDESDIYYDVEIYDMHQLVYAEKQVPDPRHTIAIELDPCQSYRWSVRPSYHLGSDIKYGEWMRFSPDTDADTDSGKGIAGRKASQAPAYIQDFALLNIECGRR